MDEKEIEKLREKILKQIDKLPEEQASNLREQIKNASPEQLESFVKKMQQMQASQGECFFCQLASGKVETIKIYEDADIIAFLDIYPANPGHVIVIPKKHFQVITEIPDALLNKIFVFVKTISSVILEVINARGLSIYMAQGPAAGQTVNHFSINIIPRFENDGVKFEWQKKKISKEELEKVGKKIREKGEKLVKEKLTEERAKIEKEKMKKEKSEAESIIKHMKKRIP